MGGLPGERLPASGRAGDGLTGKDGLTSRTIATGAMVSAVRTDRSSVEPLPRLPTGLRLLVSTVQDGCPDMIKRHFCLSISDPNRFSVWSLVHADHSLFVR